MHRWLLSARSAADLIEEDHEVVPNHEPLVPFSFHTFCEIMLIQRGTGNGLGESRQASQRHDQRSGVHRCEWLLRARVLRTRDILDHPLSS